MDSEEDGEYHFCYYPVPNTNEVLQVRLKRSSNCTAFQTWEACFAFLEWVLGNEPRFRDRKILEVGSGSGLCGQMLQCIVRSCSVIMSDYCQEVTEYILSNIDESFFIHLVWIRSRSFSATPSQCTNSGGSWLLQLRKGTDAADRSRCFDSDRCCRRQVIDPMYRHFLPTSWMD